MPNNFHTLPNLPYAYDALEPFISKEIMELHHSKHHAAYVKNLNDAIAPYEALQGKTAQELIANLQEIPEEIRNAVRNNGGGHVNHSMFWEIMKPFDSTQGGPMGVLAQEIAKTFGTFADFQAKFNDVGLKRFGSGWVWLVKTNEGKLEIVSTANQDNPMSDGMYPVMGNDVWEHAYYLQYKNMRADYVKAWWNVVNWQEIEKRFTQI